MGGCAEHHERPSEFEDEFLTLDYLGDVSSDLFHIMCEC